MQIGVIGLGRMGGNIARRLIQNGHDVVVYDHDEKAIAAVSRDGAAGAAGLDQLVAQLRPPRPVWVMLPAGKITEDVIGQLAKLLSAGDIVLDGGNTFWKDDIRRARMLKERNIHHVDVGTSGGVWGLELGYCMMVGGPNKAVKRLAPILDVLAPVTSPDSIHSIGPRGWHHFGPSGAGHYVKMVHNAVEYGIMQAYAEGFELFHSAEYDLNNAQIAHLWNQASVVRSWLCELAARAFDADGNDLAGLEGWVEDSGEGRWTLVDAIDHDVPAPALSAALFSRFYSRQDGDYSARVLAALRNQFGGHAVKKAGT
jgi:6-phosphogluconate dehydrogenase